MSFKLPRFWKLRTAIWRRWLHVPTQQELDEKFLLPALEAALDKRGITDLAERKALIARAYDVHQAQQERRTR